VVFVNGSFQPVVSVPRIDDTLKGIKCGHVEEMEESKKRGSVKCDCRKWYVYYKLDNGKIKRFHPSWDGLTCIPGSEVRDMLKNFENHKDGASIGEHFTKNMLLQDDVDRVLSEITNHSTNNSRRTRRMSA